MEEGVEREGNVISFDNFDVGCVDNLFDGSIIYFMSYNSKTGFAYYNYKRREGNVELQSFDVNSDTHYLRSFGERIPVAKDFGRGDLEEGYVFNGVLWVRPNHLEGAFGVGGRILTFVPSEIDSLNDLVLGGAKTDQEVAERLESIRRGYPAKIREEKRASEKARHDNFLEGESSGAWKQRHGSSWF